MRGEVLGSEKFAMVTNVASSTENTTKLTLKEVDIKEIRDKMAEAATRVSQAAERFVKATKMLNEGMLRIKQLNKHMLAENKKLSSLTAPKFAS